MGYIHSHLKKTNDFARKTIDSKISVIKWLLIYGDLLASIVFYGVNLSEYFQYRFYFKRHSERKKFMVFRKRMRLIKKYNGQYRKIFDDKAEFCERFSEFVGRDFLNLETCEFENFESFAQKHKCFFVKPLNGFYGIGARVYQIDETEDIQKLFHKLKTEKALAEELIVQCDEMSEFHASSVNTLRVVSFKNAAGKVFITSAVLRMGTKDSATDNFHNDGLAAAIDVETGITFTNGYNRFLQSFLLHPVSQKQITGFVVPHWNEIKKFVVCAAQVVNEICYVGWDIAIGKNGKIFVVEGNAAADPDVVQIPCDKGIWPVYQKIIENSTSIH